MDPEGAAGAERWALQLLRMSDSHFAVLGGKVSNGHILSSCEALVVSDGEYLEYLPAMHDTRAHFACAAVAGVHRRRWGTWSQISRSVRRGARPVAAASV